MEDLQKESGHKGIEDTEKYLISLGLPVPRLQDYKGDLSKRWYITYFEKSEATGMPVRKRFYGFNQSMDKDERMKAAKKFLEKIKNSLQ